MSFQQHDTLTLQKRLIHEVNVKLFFKLFLHILHPLQIYNPKNYFNERQRERPIHNIRCYNW